MIKMSLKPQYKDKSSSDVFDVNSKYLHKKFKKMAETVYVKENCSVNDDAASVREFVHTVHKESSITSVNGQSRIEDERNDTEMLQTGGSVFDKKIAPNEEIYVRNDNDATSQEQVCVQCKFESAKYNVPRKCVHTNLREFPYPSSPHKFSIDDGNYLQRSTGGANIVESEVSNRQEAHSLGTHNLHHDGFREGLPVPASLETNNNQEFAKHIYKPKFKASLHYEEDRENSRETQSATSQHLNHIIVSSPVSSLSSTSSISYRSSLLSGSEHSPRQVTKLNNGEVSIDENDSVVAENMYQNTQQDSSIGQQSSFISIASHFAKPHLPLGASMLSSPTSDHSHRLPLHSVPQRSPQAKLAVAFRPLEVESSSLHGGQPLNLSAPSSEYEKIDTVPGGAYVFHRKRIHPEEFSSASNYEYKNTVTQGSPSLAAFERVERQQLYNGESGKVMSSLHNPERFTIKDLLLKAGGKVQAVGVMQGSLKDVAVGEIITDSGVTDFLTASPNKVCYTCAVCKSSFDSAATLIIHQQLYCRQKHLLYSSEVRSLHPGLNQELENTFNSLSNISVTLSREPQPLVMNVGNTASTSPSMPSLSSPGPVLGNTLLVAKSSRQKHREGDGIVKEIEEKPHTTVTLSKRRRLDADVSTSQTVKSMGPILTVTDISGSISSVRKLEESPRFVADQKPRQMFDEVQILGGATKNKPLLGNASSRPIGSAGEVILKLPSHVRPSSFPFPTSTPKEVGEEFPRRVIVSSESPSDGAVIRVQESLNSTRANLSPSTVINSLYVPSSNVAGDIRQRSKSSSPVRKPSQNTSGGGVSNTPPPPFTYSSTSRLSPSAVSVSNPPTHSTKHHLPVLPNISLPSLPTAKIPVRTLGHHLPFMPYILGVSDRTAVNSLNQVTDSNSQTSQEVTSHFRTSISAVQQDSGGVLTIIHKGKNIPYVPGMPGPQSILLGAPARTPDREEHFSEPLDLAFSPREESVPYFSSKRSKVEGTANLNLDSKIEGSPAVYQTERYGESCAASESKKYVAAERKTTILQSPAQPHVKPFAMVEPRILSTVKASAESRRSYTSSHFSLVQGTSVIQTSDGSKSALGSPVPSSHENSKNGKTYKYQPVFENHESDDLKEEHASRQNASKEDKSRDGKTDSSSPEKNEAAVVKFHRPNSLPLKPETFVPKKHFQFGSTPGGSVVLQVSPETPRSRKSFGQLYLQGNVFTFLNLKISTRPFFCILTRTQPMYVVQTPDNPKLSMYSNWRIKKTACPNPLGLSTTEALSLYDSRNRCTTYTTAVSEDKEKMIYTHSSYWFSREHLRAEKSRSSRPDWEKTASGNKRKEEHAKTTESEASSGEPPPRKAKIFGRGFESKDDYTYVKGRGRGRYVCNDCGIRCLKPSMLRNHIRTHTNIRPYICRHCNFSFKTKGNLTKHMKSKAHYKKCIKLCIFPVPTVVDDSYIDEECFAQQAAQQGESGDTDSDENEEEEDDEEDDKESEEISNDYLEQEAAHGLLSLSEPVLPSSSPPSSGLAPLSSYTGRPSTYPYTLSVWKAGTNGSTSCGVPQSPGLTPVCAQMERETVLRNTSLAIELGGRRGDRRKDDRREMSTMVYRRDDAAPFTLIPRQNSDTSKYHKKSERASTPYEGKCLVDSRLAVDKGSDADDECGSSISCSEDDSELSGRKEKHTSDIDAYSSSSVLQPIDLSTKNLAYVSPYSRKAPPPAAFTATTSYAMRMQPAPVTEVFVSFPGPVTSTSNSSSEHCPFPGPTIDPQTQASTDSRETNILHKYLTKRDVENAKLQQQEVSVPVETPDVPMSSQAFTVTAAESTVGEHQLRETDTAHQFRQSMKHSSLENMGDEDSADRDPNVGRLQINQDISIVSTDVNVTSIQSRCSENAEGKDSYKQKATNADKAAVCIDAAPEVPSSNSDSAAENAVISRLGFSGQSWVPSSNASEPEAKAEFLPPSTRPLPGYVRLMEDGQSMCIICNKVFSKPSQLRLHVNIHCLEHPFKCELCAVSFRKKGHLKKHESSVSHQNRVGTTATVCTQTTTNPRPFKCDDCNIAFRIHGHLAKHLRSKMHIMKLECIGKLPFGTYEEMEREGFDPYDIDTTDCENSLESLQALALRLHEKDPSKLGHWSGSETDTYHSSCPSPAPRHHAQQPTDAGAGDACPSRQDPGDTGRRAASTQEFSVPSSPACHVQHI